MCKAVVPKVPVGYVRLSMLGVAVLTMSCNGYPNLNKAMSRQGEYNDPELEQLLNWIMDNTGKGKFCQLVQFGLTGQFCNGTPGKHRRRATASKSRNVI